MNTSSFDPNLVPLDVSVDDAMIRVKFQGGLELATPVARFPRLQRATPEQRKVWRLIGRGDGICWPDADEDISVRGLFSGVMSKSNSAIEEVPSLIGDLYKTTRRLNGIFNGRPFTPDGHLIGSIGEVVAEFIYDLELLPCSTPRIDAHTRDHKTVQIKLTGENGSSYGFRWSNKDPAPGPDFLLCLKLTSEGFVEIYNGPFPEDVLRSKGDQRNGQIQLSVNYLAKLNPSTLVKKKEFRSINRWFAPQLSDVA